MFANISLKNLKKNNFYKAISPKFIVNDKPKNSNKYLLKKK